MVFPILWTLDLLSLGFNFAPYQYFTPVGPPTSFGTDFPGHSTSCVTMLGSRCRRETAQCDSNHEPRPCQRDFFLFSSFFLFYLEPMEYISQWDDEVDRIGLPEEKAQYEREFLHFHFMCGFPGFANTVKCDLDG